MIENQTPKILFDILSNQYHNILMKHAYLILAHTNWNQLRNLVALLDDDRNDIYIHIDKKVDISSLFLSVKKSNLFFVDRINVFWGNVSQIEAEYKLFETAYSHGQYSYYHLISGMDLPLHTQDYIHHFFVEHAGFEFIGFGKKEWNVKERLYCHNFFLNEMRNPNKILRLFWKILRIILNKVQILFSTNVVEKFRLEYRCGCQWCSVTADFVRDLIREKDKVLSIFKYAYCPDEIYKQTFALNSRYKNFLYDVENEFNGCMREIDWNRGKPYVYTIEDIQFLMKSSKLFARKFDERIDNEVIKQLINYLKKENENN